MAAETPAASLQCLSCGGNLALLPLGRMCKCAGCAGCAGMCQMFRIFRDVQGCSGFAETCRMCGMCRDVQEVQRCSGMFRIFGDVQDVPESSVFVGCSGCTDVEVCKIFRMFWVFMMCRYAGFWGCSSCCPCCMGCTENPKPISNQFLPSHLRPNFRLHLALPAWIANGDFELKGCTVHFQSLNSIIPWCVLFNAQTACDMTEPEALQSIMPSLPTSAAVVSRQWHSAGRALGCADDPWLMGHGQSSDPTVQAVPELPQDVSESTQAWHCNTP